MRVGDKKKSQLSIQAHDCDVNVISWNKKTANLIASGGDDGAFKVWDIRFSKVKYLFYLLIYFLKGATYHKCPLAYTTDNKYRMANW